MIPSQSLPILLTPLASLAGDNGLRRMRPMMTKEQEREMWALGVKQGTLTVFQFLELIRSQDEPDFKPQTFRIERSLDVVKV